MQDPSFFLSPVQTGLPRELAKLLTRAVQPGLVSPGGSDQAQRYHPASLSSEFGEHLRHIGRYPVKETVRESVLFIGTQFSNLCTAADTPAGSA